jgi:hypothetical protein
MSSKPPSPQETEHRKKRERERGRKSIEKKKKKKKDLRVYSNKMGSQYFERRKIFQLQKFFFI